jgi:UTP--glucose-1-phosphate uridylyltransferase
MLPVVDKPLIQYAVEEALAAGAINLVFITGRNKRAIEDHFDVDPELERTLAGKDKDELLDAVRYVVPSNVNCVYVRQGEPLGLGHAVLCARPVVGDRPFFVHLADDLIDAAEPCLAQMRRIFDSRGGSVLGVEEVPADQTRQYGIIQGAGEGPRLRRLSAIVEKPAPADAPSNLAVVGRYILTPRIFGLLEETRAGTGGEIQLTDAIARLLLEEPVYGYEFEGVRFDCGSKLGYLEATVHYGLRHPELGPGFRAYLERNGHVH